MRILVDTNILLRSAQPAHFHHPAAVRAIEVLRAQDKELCLVPQVVYEFWVVATRPRGENGLGLATALARGEVERIKRLFTLFRDERAILPLWENLVRDHDVKGRNAHDARLVAAMTRHGVSHIVTFNAPDFVRYPNITVFSPEQVVHAAP